MSCRADLTEQQNIHEKNQPPSYTIAEQNIFPHRKIKYIYIFAQKKQQKKKPSKLKEL